MSKLQGRAKGPAPIPKGLSIVWPFSAPIPKGLPNFHGTSLRHRFRGWIFHPLPQKPSGPTQIEVGTLTAGKLLAESLEGVPAHRFGVAARGQALPADRFHQVAVPGRDG